jgi:hypothetical protein
MKRKTSDMMTMKFLVNYEISSCLCSSNFNLISFQFFMQVQISRFNEEWSFVHITPQSSDRGRIAPFAVRKCLVHDHYE